MPLYALVLWLGCGPEEAPLPPPATDADTDTDSDSDTDADVDTDGGSDTDSGTDTGTDTDTEPPATFSLPESTDLSALTWTEAFEALHLKIVAEYAYSAHKTLDLTAIHDLVAAEMLIAETADDPNLYYAALRHYVFAIPDGQASLSGNDHGVIDDYIEGSYGLQLVTLDDGRTIVTAVAPDSLAEDAGLAPGTEIVAWNSLPIADALAAVDVRWGERPAATLSDLASLQHRLLVRGPDGATATVTFINPVFSLSTVDLDATDDNGLGLSLSTPWPVLAPDQVIAIEPLSPTTATLRINYVAALLEGEVRDAFIQLDDLDADGLVLDLRGCDGVNHASGAEMISPLFEVGTFFETQLFMNLVTGTLEHDVDNPDDTIEIPIPVQTWKGPVVVLVNSGTVGPCELMATAVAALPNTAVVGFDNTHGSPGLPGGSAFLPEGLIVSWPIGAPAAVDDQLVLAPEQDGIGGVPLTHPIPRDEARAIDQMAGVDVEMVYASEILLDL